MFVNALIANCFNFVCPRVLLELQKPSLGLHFFIRIDLHKYSFALKRCVKTFTICVIDNIVSASEGLVEVFEN